MSGTIRSRTEAIKRIAYDAESGKTLVWGDDPDAYFHALDRILREIQQHADDTLTDLNNAPAVLAGTEEQMRVIPDPDSRDWPMPKPPPYPADDEDK